MRRNNYNNEPSFNIERYIGEISEEMNNGWKKEVNLVSWNEQPAKIDIRSWEPSHEKMSKGITLTEDEARNLHQILTDYFNEKR